MTKTCLIIIPEIKKYELFTTTYQNGLCINKISPWIRFINTVVAFKNKIDSHKKQIGTMFNGVTIAFAKGMGVSK